ncbi:MAG TPA: iron siderophore-binding protein, partial [Thermaerobacter sp.]
MLSRRTARRLTGALGTLVLIAVLLAGCGGSPAPGSGAEGSGSATASSSATGTTTGEGEGDDGGYVVRHAMGETRIPRTPERIVVLTNEATEALLALGIKPVGAVNSWVGDPWYDHIADRMEGV